MLSMERALDAEDGLYHVQPSFFFSELSCLKIELGSECLGAWAPDKGWLAVKGTSSLMLIDADMKRVHEFSLGKRWQGDNLQFEIDFVAERNLILLFDNDGMAVFRHSSNALHELCAVTYERQDDWNRFHDIPGACLSVCGRYVFTIGDPRNGHQDGISAETHIAILARCVESGEIVAETFVEVSEKHDWIWELRIPDKHLRYASDGLPLIVSLSGYVGAEDIEAHFQFQDNEFVPYLGQTRVMDVPLLLYMQMTRSDGPELEFDADVWTEEGEEIDLRTNGKRERTYNCLVVMRDAQHQEAIIFTESERFVRISLDSPKIIRGVGEVRDRPRESRKVDQMFRGAMGRMIAYDSDDSSLILFDSEGFLDFNYYRLRWRPEIHHVFPQAIRRRIETFALCIRRIGVFPKDIRRLLLRFQVINF